MPARGRKLTARRARELLRYEADTGEFFWRVTRSHNAKEGQKAGGINAEGYLVIMIDGESYKASRLAFLIMEGKWPPHTVDHRDLDRSNNRWANLRSATPVENGYNKPLYKNNTTGHKGVYRYGAGRYRARIRVNRSLLCLGIFDDLEAAVAAYAAASEQLHGAFGRTS